MCAKKKINKSLQYEVCLADCQGHANYFPASDGDANKAEKQ